MILVVAVFAGPFVPFAHAGLFGGGGISIPSPSQIAGELENRYHINVGSIQDQSETFNVAGQKKTVPEVSLFFSPSDPKPGEKITANALPSFFSNETSNLYFSWYLQRKGCDRDNSPSAATRTQCDNDGNGKIDANDWKIEAMRTLATNGFDNADTTYGNGDDTDDDGYTARFGGDNKVGTRNDYCAIHDASSGTVYEIVDNISNLSGVCGSGLSPACVSTTSGASVTPGSVTGGFSGDVSGSAFTPSAGENAYTVVGYPQCSGSVASCSSGSLRCLSDPKNISELGSAPVSTVCSGQSGVPASDCRHLFPKISGFTAGDGSFGVDEERFWHTNPKDPGTAQNGNKDEANIVGLGQNNFTWNYDSGDKVGVAVEGTSMLATKHDNSSSYIMWGFSKNDCPLSTATSGIGAYTDVVRGYSVSFPAVTANLNDCLERNLIDPTEGGQPARMEVSVSASPENPMNDESADQGGDIVNAYANITNSSVGTEGQLFDWTVSIANNIQFDNSGSGRRSKNITADLKAEKLLGVTRGSGLASISLPMNMPSIWKNSANRLSDFVNGDGVGYVRFSVAVSENFSSNVARKGRGDVILKFQTIKDRISAYQVSASGNPLKLSILSNVKNGGICNDLLSRNLVCPVMKNEIVGLKIGSSGFTDYSWTIDGKALRCSKTISDQCLDDAATNVNFLPIFGDVGDLMTVSVNAVDVVSGKKATLSRAFRIVDPTVEIISADTNMTWPKLLGQYKDAAGNLYNDMSRDTLQVFGGGTLRMKASFLPGFLKNNSEGRWTIDGDIVAENANGEIEFPIGKEVGNTYRVTFEAAVIQSPAIRQALQQFWNISTFDSGEDTFSKSVRVEVLGSEDNAVATGSPRVLKQFAAIASFIPASVLFSVKAFFSMMIILLVSGFMMTLAPEALPRRSRE
jgi:hypothetical protein